MAFGKSINFSGQYNRNVMITVDTTELQGVIAHMRLIHTRDQFRRLMERAFQRTAPRVRTILKKEIPPDYAAKPAWIGRQVGSPQTFIGAEVTCTIPVSGIRGKVGREYRASATEGTARVRKAYRKLRKSKANPQGKSIRRSYKVMAQVLAGETSELPQGGRAVHFMVFTGSHKGRVFARLPQEGDRIRPGVGIGVPQMPANRSEQAVQDGIRDLLYERIQHEHMALVRGYAK
jgi:hypothetical protein